MGEEHKGSGLAGTRQAHDRSAADAWLDAMRRGDFAAAWRVNDAVLAARDPATRDDPALPYHLRWVWDGTAPDGRDVLVRCYHGLGDTLQFSRYLLLLAARAARLTVEVQPELRRFLDGMVPGARWVPFRQEAPLPPAPCTMEVMEAGHVLRCLPPPLFPPVQRRRRAGALQAGVCWTGGDWDPARWVPAELLGVLAGVAGVRWTCLQQGRADGPFGPALPPGGDVADTAAVVRELDVVVTADTMMAHLAGTLGVPAFVLLKAAPDWRWLPGGRRFSPWYPSARLYRQPAPGDWRAVLREVARDLALAGSGAWEELAPATNLPDVAAVP